MKWFGPSWGAPINDEMEEAPTPDWECLRCGEEFDEDDQGVVMPFEGDPDERGEAAYHLHCFRECITGEEAD